MAKVFLVNNALLTRKLNNYDATIHAKMWNAAIIYRVWDLCTLFSPIVGRLHRFCISLHSVMASRKAILKPFFTYVCMISASVANPHPNTCNQLIECRSNDSI